MNAYDDPYVMLAHHVISVSNNAEMQRVLLDDEYLMALIRKETRSQDFSGAFVDCIVQSILDDKRRMEFMHELDKLAVFFYNNLDKERLRQNIVKYAAKYGLYDNFN